jgi:cellulose biosynthesis protein BcsQ
MKTIALFNNKGGVGKTTLTCNLAAHLALRMNKRVLVIDCDPQCNSTQLVLGNDAIAGLYGADGVLQGTLLQVVRLIDVGDAGIDPDVEPFAASENRFGVDLIAGHPRMSIVEDRLSGAWQSATAGDLGGLRITNWCADLCKALDARYDFALLDLGPSLGSLNRSVLLGADYFVTPMGGDIFSIVALRNISLWLNDWLNGYRVGVQNCDERKHPGGIDRFGLRKTVPIEHGFIGYTIQQYITKSYSGVRRPTVAFEKILKDVPIEIERNLLQFLSPGLDLPATKLGDVPNLFSLIALAQTASAPLIDLNSKDGLVGSQYQQAEQYARIVSKVAESLAANLKTTSGEVRNGGVA